MTTLTMKRNEKKNGNNKNNITEKKETILCDLCSWQPLTLHLFLCGLFYRLKVYFFSLHFHSCFCRLSCGSENVRVCVCSCCCKEKINTQRHQNENSVYQSCKKIVATVCGANRFAFQNPKKGRSAIVPFIFLTLHLLELLDIIHTHRVYVLVGNWWWCCCWCCCRYYTLLSKMPCLMPSPFPIPSSVHISFDLKICCVVFRYWFFVHPFLVWE